MSSGIQGNYVDQAWAHQLPGYFKENVKPSVARDAFLIPRDNIAMPNIVTMNTLGAVNDRGFIDYARTRLSTVRNAILNPSTYVKRLHPHDVTSGTGGIENLSNLHRFGQPVPFADGEDFADFQFWSRYNKDPGLDPLTEGYAVKALGDNGASVAEAMRKDRKQDVFRQQMRAEMLKQGQKKAGEERTAAQQRAEAEEAARIAEANPAAPATDAGGEITGAVAPPVDERPMPRTSIDPFADLPNPLGDRVNGATLRRNDYTIVNLSTIDDDYGGGGQYIAYSSRQMPTYMSERDDLLPDEVNSAIFTQNRMVEDLYGEQIFSRNVAVDDEDDENEEAEDEEDEEEGDEDEDEDEDEAGPSPEGADAPGTGVAGGAPAGRGGVNGRAGAADIAQRLGENTADVRDTLRATVEAAATTMRQDNAAAPSWRKEMLSNVQEKMEIQKLMGSHTSNLASVYSNSYVATPMAKRPRTMGIEGDFHAVRGSKPPGSFAALFEPRVEQTTYAGGDVFSAAEKAADPRYALLHGRRPSASTYLAPDLAASSGTFRQLQSQARSNRYDGNIDGPSEQSSLSIQNPNHARNMAHRVAAEFSHAPPQSRQTAGVLNRNQQTPVSNITIANRGSTSSDPSTAFRAGQPRRRR